MGLELTPLDTELAKFSISTTSTSATLDTQERVISLQIQVFQTLIIGLGGYNYPSAIIAHLEPPSFHGRAHTYDPKEFIISL